MGNAGSSPLHAAARDGDLSAFYQKMQKHSSDIDKQEPEFGWTPLHVAAYKGFDAIVRELLARGANPNQQDKEGRTALALACQQGHTEAVRALLRGRADRNLRDKAGKVPYDLAVGKYPVITQLLGPPAAPAAPAPGPPAFAQQQQQQQQAPPPPQLLQQPAPSGPGPLQAARLAAQQQQQQLPPAGPGAPAAYGAYPGAAPTYAAYRNQYPGVPDMTVAPPPAGAASAPAAPAPAYYAYAQQAPSAPPPAAAVATTPAYYGYHQQQAAPAAPAAAAAGRTSSGGGWGAGSGAEWGGAGAAQEQQQQQAASAPPAARHAGSHGGSSAADLDWGESARGDDWGSQGAGHSAGSAGGAPAAPLSAQPSLAIERAQQQLAALGITAPGGAQQQHHQQQAQQQQQQGQRAARGSEGGSSVASGGSSLYGGPAGRLYRYEELHAATRGFAASNKIGQGGYGPVYRGVLDGVSVAIKCMEKGPDAMQGAREFQSEVAILSRLHHPHIVLLLGSCPEQGMLVYELMDNGSLEDHLFDGQQQQHPGQQAPRPAGAHRPLPWQERVRVAAEIASALLFLHSAPEPIVHMDMKPSNILLDRNLTAKLGDVGLARLLPSLGAALPGQSAVQDSRLVGTLQYMDPEYLRTGTFSRASDTYGLGMVMLQLLTGQDSARVVSVVEEARKAAAQGAGDFQQVIDPRAGGWPAAEALAFADVALKCVEYRRQDRPDIRYVVLPALVQLRQRTQLYPPPAAAAAVQQAAAADQVPPMFVCPITQEVFEDPVFAADGYTYERAAIAEWIARSPTSPLTNLPLPHTQLVPNHSLRSAVQEWREAQRHRQQQRQ